MEKHTQLENCISPSLLFDSLQVFSGQQNKDLDTYGRVLSFYAENESVMYFSTSSLMVALFIVQTCTIEINFRKKRGVDRVQDEVTSDAWQY